MAIVTDDAQQQITFYTFGGEKTDSVSPSDIGNILDI
jgi:hypothetical protein